MAGSRSVYIETELSMRDVLDEIVRSGVPLWQFPNKELDPMSDDTVAGDTVAGPRRRAPAMAAPAVALAPDIAGAARELAERIRAARAAGYRVQMAFAVEALDSIAVSETAAVQP